MTGKTGVLITFEGLDGAGKTTQINMLEEYLRRQNYSTVVTREPGGTRISEKIRHIILDTCHGEMDAVTEMLLYAAARAQLVAQIIQPALSEGKIVLCDRFVDSSIAYQGFGRQLGMEMVQAVNTPALHGIVPDITLLLSIDPEKGLKRSKKGRKGTDRLEQENMEFYRRVEKGFQLLQEKYPHRVKRINAECSIKEVHSQVLDAIGHLL